MRLGLAVTQFNFPAGTAGIGPGLADTARRAEAAGFDSFWLMDHFFQIDPLGPAEDPMLEGYTALGFAAAVTERIKLGTLVTGVTYRHPGLLVKTVTTLDVLAGGRAYLGIGAAWNEREHRGLGVPFPPVAERFERLEETLRIAHRMWSGDRSPVDGRHYHLAEPINSPPALADPHPPILVGGGGEKKTLRLVARYADACNLFAGDPAEIRRKLDVLRAHCDAEGRPYDAIEKTTSGMIVSRDGAGFSIPVAEAAEQLHQLAELGIDHHVIGVPPGDLGALDLVATELVPLAARLAVAGR